jgi:hypothetical protein
MFSITAVRDVYAFRAIIVSQPGNPDGDLYIPGNTVGNHVFNYNVYRSPSIGQGVVFEPEAVEGYTTFSSEDVTGVAYIVKEDIATPTYGTQSAIPLTSLLIDYLGFGSADDGAKGRNKYTYTIVALDPSKSKTNWTYAEMQKAYYLTEKDIICQIEAGDVVAVTIVPFPKKIEISGGNAPATQLIVDTTKKHPGTAAYKDYFYN